MSWSRFFRRRYWDQERAREIESYLEIETAENVARGMDARDARHAARRKLGNATQIREELYLLNTIGLVETLWQDLRYGARLLRLSPGFTAVALLSLALGIGANTAIFQLLNSIRLSNLPVTNPHELAVVRVADRDFYAGYFRGRYYHLSYPLWEQIRDHQQAFSGIFAWGAETFNLAPGGEVDPAEGIWVSGEFFEVLGVEPLLGRLFNAADDRPGCGSPGVVISHAFWQRRFGGDDSVVGRRLTLQDYPFEILGVAPASFFGVEVGRRFDVAVPFCADPIIRGERSRLAGRDTWWLAAMGRLKPGWSVEQATAHLKAITPPLLEATLPPRYRPEQVKRYREFKLAAFAGGSGFSSMRHSFSTPLWLLLAIAGLVLLIACANLANLMLARASARQREIAVRLALGASRGRLIRQLLSESLLLAMAGAAAGALLAYELSRLLIGFLSTPADPAFVNLPLDGRLLAFTAGLAILTCLLFGLAPALRATRAAPVAAMRASGRGLTAGRERFGLRRALVVSQVALSCVLLVGAALFVRSLVNLLTLDAGFQQEGILIASVDMTRLKLPQERLQSSKQELIDRLRTIPGVQQAAGTRITPITGGYANRGILVGGQPSIDSVVSWITPGYFQTLGIALQSGRDFNRRDTVTSRRVAIVNESFADRILQRTNPIGATFRFEANAGEVEPIYEIVGLVRNTRFPQLRDEIRPIVYVAALQHEAAKNSVEILIRASTPLDRLLPAVKDAIGKVNPTISVRFRVFETQIRESLRRERLMATLSAFFGFLAVSLAAIGLYGVMSYLVARRRNEIGVRMALGADRRDVLAMILKEAGRLVGVGLIVGIGLAVVAAHTARSMLFGLGPNDLATLLMSAAGLAAIALIASYLPARRAANLNPTVALREE